MADARAELSALTEEFYSVWFRYRPDAALAAGVDGYEGMLPAQDDDEIAALSGWLETLVLALEEIDHTALDDTARLDWLLMHTAARYEHEELADGGWRMRDPARFLPLHAIYRSSLTPPQTMRERLATMLAALPEHLRHAQARLRDAAPGLAPLLVRAAAREADSGRCFLRELVHGSWLRRHWHGLSELECLAESACDALLDYRATLIDEVLPRAAGAAGCGADRLAARLAGVHFLDCDPPDLHRVLDAAEESSAREMELLARTAGDPVNVLLQRAASRLPGDADRVKAHQEICDALARELVETGLVSLPDAALEIGVRPACARQPLPGADYLATGPVSGTLVLAGTPEATTGEPLEAIRTRCLDQGWGGRHLISFTAPSLAQRLPRRVSTGHSLTAGWSLYLGHRLAASGQAPAERLAWELDRRRLAILRARVDLALHGEGLGEAEATARLSGAAMHEKGESELARIAAHPGDALAAVLGWRLIEEARRHLESAPDRGIDARGLHDRLLGQGEVPLPLALCFGVDRPTWAAARQRVLDL